MNFNELVAKSVIQIKESNEFFGALMLFSEFKSSRDIPTAATDGKKVFINEKFFNSLNSSEQNGLLLHEVLHMALLHVPRMGTRDLKRWNIAADYVVNDLIVRNSNFSLPAGAIKSSKKEYWDKSVEYIYEKIPNSMVSQFANTDLIPLKNDESSSKDQKSYDRNASSSASVGTISDDCVNYWKDKINLLKNSSLYSKSKLQGFFPGGIEKEIEAVTEPEVDWRSALWKFVSKTPSDFDDLDRRFIYKKLYLEGLMTDSVIADVCIDTSGSISPEQLDQFMGELNGILSSYPNIKVNLYYCDTELFGPYELGGNSKIPSAKGFGGTSFIPFFEAIEKTEVGFNEINRVAVYLTDGYGDFPKNCSIPTMWLATHDGLERSGFPFGEVIRISK
tara:strand:- start:5127 stop:6299 length:1173 start_codon:yes stop_codon:yes gene_type:complete